MTSKDLLKIIENPAEMNAEVLGKLEKLIARYPYFSTVQTLYEQCLDKLEAEARANKQPALSVFYQKFYTYLKNQPDEISSNQEISESNWQKHENLIETFIQENPKIKISQADFETPFTPLFEDDSGEISDDFFSETLANIYIKQKKYEKAIKIFKKLILQYPEKSVYFADQIRFCEIVVENQKKS